MTRALPASQRKGNLVATPLSPCRILYFSGTGNALALARELATALSAPPPQAMADLPANGPVELGGTTVILVFPVYAWGPPRLVWRLLHRLRTRGLIHAVCTPGGFAGGTLHLVARSCRHQGLRFGCGFSVTMPNNYLPLAPIPPPRRCVRQRHRASRKLAVVARAVQAGHRGHVEGNDVITNAWTTMVHRLSLGHFAKAAKYYTLAESCTGCRLCARICPTANIQPTATGRPVFGGNCEHCLACLHWCPVQAIDLGSITRGRNRYHHPQVQVGDLLRPAAMRMPPS